MCIVVTLTGVISASSTALNAVAFDRWLNVAVAVGGSSMVFSTQQSAYLTWSNMNYSSVRSNVPQSQLSLYAIAVISSGMLDIHRYIHTYIHAYRVYIH